MGRGVHSRHQVGFGFSISGRFKIGFCAPIDFYIIVNPFLSWVKSGSVTRLGEYKVIRFVLNTRKFMI